jgi:hypothetical protein
MYAGVPGLSIEGTQNETRTARSQGAAVEAPAQVTGAAAEEVRERPSRAGVGCGPAQALGPASKDG